MFQQPLLILSNPPGVVVFTWRRHELQQTEEEELLTTEFITDVLKRTTSNTFRYDANIDRVKIFSHPPGSDHNEMRSIKDNVTKGQLWYRPQWLVQS